MSASSWHEFDIQPPPFNDMNNTEPRIPDAGGTAFDDMIDSPLPFPPPSTPPLPLPHPSEPARYQVLWNSDILGTILQYVAIKGRDDSLTQRLNAETRKQLLSIAMVCQAFLSPALDSLWESMDSLLPLLKILSTFVQMNGVYVLNGAPKNMWAFELYAQRIKIITLGLRSDAVSEHVYVRLAQLSATALLPALRQIHIAGRGSDSTAAFLLVPPHTQYVELREAAMSQNHFYEPFMSYIAERVPSLKHLSLRGHSFTFETILRFRNLETLEIRFPSMSVSSDLVERLGRLDCLKSIVLDIRVETAPPSPSAAYGKKKKKGMRPPQPPILQMPTSSSSSSSASSAPRRLFKSLESLHLCGNADSMHRILEIIRPEDLLSITFELRDHGSNLNECITEIGRAAHSLKSFRITEADNYSVELSMETISPLFVLKDLQELVITVQSLQTESIPANGVPNFITFFPCLRRLVLPATWRGQALHLPFLSHVATICPQLESTSLTIDSTDLTGCDSDHHPIRESVRRLEISDQRPEDYHNSFPPVECKRVALFLDQVFPNLESVGIYRDAKGNGGGNEQHWIFIEDLRQTFRKIRIHASFPCR